MSILSVSGFESLKYLESILINTDKIGIVTYITAGIISIPQVFVAKQWNLVLVNLNVAIAYTILYFS